MKKQLKNQQSGRSMIEMVGVLAVMGLITAAAFVLINSALSSQRLSRIDDDVSGIVNGVRLLYNTSSDFKGVDAGNPSGNDTLVVLGFGKDEEGKEYKNPYGGNYLLTSNETDKTFIITITGLGEKTCTVLSKREWSGATDVGACKEGDDGMMTVGITYGKTDTKINL